MADDNNLINAVKIGSLTNSYTINQFVGTTDTIDYYRFTLDQNGVLGTQISDLAGTVKVSLIKDFDGDNGIDSNETIDSFFENDSLSQNQQIEAGEYFLEITPSSFSTNTNYNLRLDFTAVPATTASNPGNNLSTALNVGSVTESKILKDFVGETDSLDYYRFTLDQNGSFGWQIKDLDATARVKLIKDFDKDNGIDDGEVLDDKFASADEVLNRPLEAGEYFIEVGRSSTSTNINYTLQLDFAAIPATTSSNPGNDLGTALNLGILSDTKSLTDFVGYTDRSDYYKFTLDKNLKLNWQIGSLVDTVLVELIRDIDGDGGVDSNEILDNEFANSDESLENDLAAGDYFFRVSPSSSSGNTNYKLTLSSPDLNIPPVTTFPLINSFSTGAIGQINTSTGVFTPIGTNSTKFADIALSNNSELFGVGFDSKLYRINLSSNTSTSIGSLGVEINALDFAGDGNLYGTGSNGFYRIDTSNGQATLVKTITDFFSSGDIVFNSANNQFLATSKVDSNDNLFSIALDGTATKIGNIGFSNVFGLFGENGTLFGYTSEGKQITINPATGAGTLSKTVTGINGSIGGGASTRSSLTIPTSSSILDVDGNGQVTPSRDSLLLGAFVFFYTSTRTDYSVLDKFILAPDATRKTGNDVANYLKDKIANFDADGNGQVTPSRDSLLLGAFVFFYTSTRTDYSVLDKFILAPDATRKTGNDVANYLKGLLTGSSSVSSANYASVEDLNVVSNNITGTISDDRLTGNADNNLIVGGAGNDILTGGEGKDTFGFGVNSGNDRITDFKVAEDLIQIDSGIGFADNNAVLAAVSYQGSIAELVLSADNVITIEVDRSLTVDNFILI
jgi:RTX calcium-binding nonapeptide repeat (4 copies)